ncbi:MAG: lasso peptide biosynthesis B2 protein [Cyanobacteria bacterium]|nr:lasso peptide biosynthesis B2 protein [Cyanobacteriota bacterium]
MLLIFDVRRRLSGGRPLQVATVDVSVLLAHIRVTPLHVVEAVAIATALYWKPVLCLQRSVCTVALMRSLGIRADLVIGYRTRPFVSHAWVTVDNRVVNDSPAYARRLRTLLVA